MAAPKPPDPYKTADAQGGMNRDAALTQQLVNMTNQVDAAGNTLTYQKTGKRSFTDLKGKKRTQDVFTATQKLSDKNQAIFDQSQRSAQNLADAAALKSKSVGDLFGRELTFDGAPTIRARDNARLDALSRAGVSDFAADRQRVESALMDRLNPQLEEQRRAAEARAIAKGLRPGSAAYDSEMSGIGRNENDARLAVIGAAGDEQSRLFAQDQSEKARMFNQASQFEDSAFAQSMNDRQRYITEAEKLRAAPINELAALMSGSQIQTPQLALTQTPQASVGAPDYMGAVNQNYQARLQNHNSMLGGIGGLFGSVLGLFSDRRLKRGIVPVCKTANGLLQYAWRYLWSDQVYIGPMADEVPPEARFLTPSGFYAVNYGAVL